jgi:nucleotide-binding universal stress UspA family protein
MRRILVATDGSAPAARAVDRAADLASHFAAALDIVHVLLHGRPTAELARIAVIEHLLAEPAEVPAAAFAAPGFAAVLGRLLGDVEAEIVNEELIARLGDEILAKAAERARAAGARQVKTHVLAGDGAGQIVGFARSSGAELVVVGSRGLGLLPGPLLGSVSQKVAQLAPCSVLIAR